jgi:hypothetical protein
LVFARRERQKTLSKIPRDVLVKSGVLLDSVFEA